MGIFTANGEVLLIVKRAIAMFGNVTKRVTEAFFEACKQTAKQAFRKQE